ncbi:hypothetical protein BS78_04G157500 [Paspalum vaginatum]|nr:hypothetical protein BS78_04G157500 [Paspalum vaginatum]
MAQDGPHDHQDDAASDDHSFAPPTTVTYSLSPGGDQNDNGGVSGSSTGSPEGMDASSKRKDVVVHKEEGGSACGSHPESGGSKGKRSAEEVADAADDASNNGLSKGKSLAAAGDDDDDGGLKGHIFTERLRRKRLRDMFGALNALVPDVVPDQKRDKAAIVGDAVTYIKELQKTVDALEKRKKEQELARQAAAAKAAVANSSSSAPALMTAHGMAAMFSEAPQVQQPPAAAAPPPAGTAAPPPPLVETTGPAGFRTWSAWNVVLSVSNDAACISVCAPRRPGMLTLLLSVLNKYGIDVVSVHVSADGLKSLFSIYARVSGLVVWSIFLPDVSLLLQQFVWVQE